jgi:hypothetical protein
LDLVDALHVDETDPCDAIAPPRNDLRASPTTEGGRHLAIADQFRESPFELHRESLLTS